MTSETPRLLLEVLMQSALGVAIFMALWQLTVVGFRIPKYLVPLPLDVARSVRQNWAVIAGQAGFTLLAAGLGLAASSLFAVAVALSFSMSRNLAQASLPVVMVFRSTPVAAVAPIMMLIFGRGISTSMAVVTIVSFFPVPGDNMRGLENAGRNAPGLLAGYGAPRWQPLRFFRTPCAL